MNQYSPGREKERIGNYVGIAMKAGKISAGDAAAFNALKAKKATLLLLAEDTAAATAKELLVLAEAGNLPVLWWTDKVALGLLVGKSRRGALALLDEGFTRAILKLCELKSNDNVDEINVKN